MDPLPRTAPADIDPQAVEAQLERVLASPRFRRAQLSSALLRYVVERALHDGVDRLKEYTIGVEALGRGAAFDPRTDPIVRAEASRLRERLDRYYAGDGRDDPIVLRLPKGSYIPLFERGPAAEGPPAASPGVPPAVEPVPGRPERSTSRRQAFWLGGTLLLIAAVAAAAWVLSGGPPATSAPFLQFEVELAFDGTLGSDVGPDIALSADGTRIVFVGRDADGRTHLYTRRLDQAAVVRLEGTEGARVPFLSPDGRWVGFWAEGKVKRTPVGGGSPVVLCEATDLLGASWGEDGFIVAALNPTGKLWRIPEVGGTPHVVLDLSPEAGAPLWPQLLPGGGAVLYTVTSGAGADQNVVEALDLSTGERKVLYRGGTYARYLPSGHLTFLNQGTLYAVPFDARRLAVRGTPVPVLENVAYSPIFGYAQVDVARTGTLVYRRSAASGPFVVARVDREGRTEPLLAAPGRYSWLRMSPDGQRLAFTTVESGTAGIWIKTLGDGEVKRVPGAAVDYMSLTWLPDGARLIAGGRSGLAWIDAERADAPRPLTTSTAAQVPVSFAPGSGRLAYHQMHPTTGFDLWTVPLSSTAEGVVLGPPEPFLRTPAFEVYPSFSPDGRWIAYASNQSGTYEIYVRPYPEGNPAVKVSVGGGRIPLWSANGRELLYQRYDQRIMATIYRVDGDSFRAGPPRLWTPQRVADAGVFPSFDVAPGEEQIVALLPAGRTEDRQSPNHVTFMLNFADAVGRRIHPADTVAPGR